MKYFVLTLGCQMNKSDSERLEAVLDGAGAKRANSMDDADLIVVNACSVRQSAVDRIFGQALFWNKLKKKNPKLKVALTGCVLPADKKKFEKSGFIDLIFNIREMNNLPGWLGVEKLGESGKRNIFVDEKVLSENSPAHGCEYLEIKPKYSSKFTAFVPIMTGCNNYCTYCAVPYTRGSEVSRSLINVLTEVRGLLNEGRKEIILLGQNVNSYRGIDENGKIVSFVDLCRKIDEIPGNYWVRFTSSNPYNFPDELIDFLASSRHFCRAIHVAIQSGDDEILKKMNRHNTAEEIATLLKKIREKIPDVTLTTDVIVGFCGESEKAFERTLALVKAGRFSQIYIGQYSPRPGTYAAKMFKDDIPKKVKAEREKRLNSLLQKIAKEENERFEGRRMKVLVERRSKNKFFGRIEQGIMVGFKGEGDLVGKFVDVKIKKAEAFGLEGDLICE